MIANSTNAVEARPHKTAHQRLRLKGYTISRSDAKSPDLFSQIPASHHVLRFNFDSPMTISWKSQGKWTRSVCTTGNVVALRSSGDYEELQCLQKFNRLEISFEPDFIDTLIDKKGFRFHSQYNIEDFLLRDIGRKLYEGNLSAKSLELLYVDSLLITCVIHLATNYPINDKKIFAPKGKLSSHQLSKLIDFVRANINGTITLDDLASSIHLSVFHFSRLFKNTIGVSPYQFVLGMKIDYSKQLIKNQKAISDIAYALGFTDSAHFCNAFKKYTGSSPLRYEIPVERM